MCGRMRSWPCGFSAAWNLEGLNFFSEPNFYMINGEKKVRLLCSISVKAGGGLHGENLTNYALALALALALA